MLTRWVTFAPCFPWVFALAPWIERLERANLLRGALALITSAIVGVIANLSVWFALHVLFRRLYPATFGPIRGTLPDPSSLDWRAGLIAAVCGWAILGARQGIVPVLMLGALGGALLSAVQ